MENMLERCGQVLHPKLSFHSKSFIDNCNRLTSLEEPLENHKIPVRTFYTNKHSVACFDFPYATQTGNVYVPGDIQQPLRHDETHSDHEVSCRQEGYYQEQTAEQQGWMLLLLETSAVRKCFHVITSYTSNLRYIKIRCSFKYIYIYIYIY